MHEFRVWAPLPERVELVLGERRVPMTPVPGEGEAGGQARAPGGWWLATDAASGPGSDYAFSLDGGPPRPDPRSAFQPYGVDGPSRVVGQREFSWTDAGWRGVALPGAVIYECHVGTFSAEGTFDGAIAHLDHLAELGVDAVELLPVAEFSGDRGWGYDGVDLFAPHHAYGGPDGLKRLVDAAHARGIGVVLDVVYNHLGPAGNYLPEFGPYFSAQHKTNWGDAVNFDGPGSDEVRRFVIDNALSWLRDYHVDGLRLDAVHAFADSSAVHICEQLAAEVAALAAQQGRPLFLIAESDLNDPRFARDREAGGYGLDAAWADEWHHALHSALTGERDGYYEDFGPLPLLAKALRQAWVYDGVYSPHRQRTFGRSPAGLPGNRFVVCTQNHDQVGNRAAGERSSALMSEGRLRIAAALLLTSPFGPMLFQGEEWGAATPFQYFTGHPDPALGRAVSEGRRREFAAFGWDPSYVPDPQDPATFNRSKLNWDELAAPRHSALLAWYRELIALRRERAEFADPRLGSVRTEYDLQAGWLVVRRGPTAVAVNLGTQTWTFPASPQATLLAVSDDRIGSIYLAGKTPDGTHLATKTPDGKREAGVVLPPDTVAIVTGLPAP
jgi:maltooligosyltrehalose trehalohydrolase